MSTTPGESLQGGVHFYSESYTNSPDLGLGGVYEFTSEDGTVQVDLTVAPEPHVLDMVAQSEADVHKLTVLEVTNIRDNAKQHTDEEEASFQLSSPLKVELPGWLSDRKRRNIARELAKLGLAHKSAQAHIAAILEEEEESWTLLPEIS